MAPPSGIYVDLVHATTPNGQVQAGQSFSWYNSGGTPGCTVSGVGNWCAESSYGPIGAGDSKSATALSTTPTGNYSYVCPCCVVANPTVGVHGMHMPKTGKEETAA